MRDGFAHGESQLVRIQLAAKQDRQQIMGALRLRTSGQHFRQAVGVMTLLLLDAPVQAPERTAMRRQHQGIHRQAVVGFQGIQVQRQGIGL